MLELSFVSYLIDFFSLCVLMLLWFYFVGFGGLGLGDVGVGGSKMGVQKS